VISSFSRIRICIEKLKIKFHSRSELGTPYNSINTSFAFDRLLQIFQAQDINISNLLPMIGPRTTIIFRTTTTILNTSDILTLIPLVHSNLFRYVVFGVNLFPSLEMEEPPERRCFTTEIFVGVLCCF
jgi:hypothetical protein